MKRSLVWVVLVVCSLVLAGCSGGRKILTDEEAYKRFVGTWVNTAYPGTLARSQVTVIRPDYVGEDWLFPNSTSPDGQWEIKVKKTWVDEKGNTYCQCFLRYIKGSTSHLTALMRVDKEGKVWEITTIHTSENDFYPEVIDPQLQNYWVYYRK
jgi:hypothetical protein